MTRTRQTANLPLRSGTSAAWNGSLLLAVLVGSMSLAGLLFTDQLYTSEDQVRSFLPNDAINLVFGLPILVGTMALCRRGAWFGLLAWPGAVLYQLYNYTAYVVGIPPVWMTAVNLGIVLLSAGILFSLLRAIDGEAVQAALAGTVSERLGGGFLVIFGVFFLFQGISLLAGALSGQSATPLPDIGVTVADLVLSTLWIGGGSALILRRPFGYASGLGLLFSGVALTFGLLFVLLLQPLMTRAPFDGEGVIVISVMGLISLIPFGLFWRGVASAGIQR